MGTAVDHMSNLNMNSNSDSTTLSVPKLCDDGSNWADYQPRIERVLGSKGLWRHVLGAAIALKPYILLAGVPVIADGKTPATEEQIEAKEAKIQEYERKEYLAQHVILSTTSTRIGSKIKNMTSMNEMWEAVKADTTMKSSLYLLDAEDQLASMKQAWNCQIPGSIPSLWHPYRSPIARHFKQSPQLKKRML
jgi:predicted metal-dependent hydrolase